MTPIPTTDLSVDEIQLGQFETWARPDREGLFARLRAERPISFHEEGEFPGVPKGPGFWSAVRYERLRRSQAMAGGSSDTAITPAMM